MKQLFLLFSVFMLVSCSQPQGNTKEKPRTIITTDGEVDDMDSFIRMLLYSSEMDIVGLIYSSSMWHYSGDGKGTLFTSEMPMTQRMYQPRIDLRWPGTTWMEELVDKYAVIYPSLMKHDSNYPSPDYLKSIIRIGNIEFEGEMAKDTEGSDFIKSILLDDKPGKVYIQAWGGTNTAARALKSIEDQYRGSPEWNDIYRKVSEKTVLYLIMDQDATYRNYVASVWPDIQVIRNSSQFGAVAYWWDRSIPRDLHKYLDGKWFSENILFNHGPLLETYYTWGDGRQITGDPEHIHGSPEMAAKSGRAKFDFLSEGDSPAYFYLLDFGLRSTEDPSYGGLGGRFVKSPASPGLWDSNPDAADLNPFSGKPDPSYPQARWIGMLQNDFEARADWCVLEYNEANHAPVVQLTMDSDIEASPGEKIRLQVKASDPDGNSLKYSWWQYKEAGTLDDTVQIENSDSKNASIVIPAGAEAGKTIHIIAEVSDDGTPGLIRYKRVIITIK